MRKLFADYLNGVNRLTLTRTLNELGIRTRFGNPFDRRNVEYILKNPVYIGKLRWTPTGRVRRQHDHPDTIVSDGKHLPLIDEETFDATQKKLEQERLAYGKHRREDGRPFMLKGLVKCSCCGSTLVSAAKGTSLQCHSYAKGKCPESHFISLKNLTASVLEQITRLEQSKPAHDAPRARASKPSGRHLSFPPKRSQVSAAFFARMAALA